MTTENENKEAVGVKAVETVETVLTAKQRRVKGIIAKLKDYIDTYPNQIDWTNYEDETIINDIVYGLGIALDKEEHKYFDGFQKFKKKLIQHLNETTVVGVETETVSITKETLEEWRVALSQGDTDPRWEIEKLLADPED